MLVDLPLYVPQDKNQGRTSAKVNAKGPACFHAKDKSKKGKLGNTLSYY